MDIVRDFALKGLLLGVILGAGIAAAAGFSLSGFLGVLALGGLVGAGAGWAARLY